MPTSMMPYKVMPCQVRLSSTGAAGAAGAAALCACAKPVAASRLAVSRPFLRGARPRLQRAPGSIRSRVIFPSLTANTPVVWIVGFNRRFVTEILLERIQAICSCLFFATSSTRWLDGIHISRNDARRKMGFMEQVGGTAAERRRVAGCGRRPRRGTGRGGRAAGSVAAIRPRRSGRGAGTARLERHLEPGQECALVGAILAVDGTAVKSGLRIVQEPLDVLRQIPID